MTLNESQESVVVEGSSLARVVPREGQLIRPGINCVGVAFSHRRTPIELQYLTQAY